MNRPDCAGWHEPDPLCDGDPSTGEPACAYRSRCLVIKGMAAELGGGEASIKAILNRHAPSETFDEELAVRDRTCSACGHAYTGGAFCPACARLTGEPREAPTPAPDAAPAESRPKTRGKAEAPPTGPSRPLKDVPPLPPVNDTKGGKVMTARELHPRPESRYSHVLPIIDAFVAAFAKKVGKRLLREGDEATRPGDLFLRYTPGMQGRLIGLYEATDRGTRRHRLITRFVMLVREPRFNLKTNIPSDRYTDAVACSPPTGPECRVWNDSKPHVALVGVDAHATPGAARWLASCYHEELVDDVRRRGTARTRAGVAS